MTNRDPHPRAPGALALSLTGRGIWKSRDRVNARRRLACSLRSPGVGENPEDITARASQRPRNRGHVHSVAAQTADFARCAHVADSFARLRCAPPSVLNRAPSRAVRTSQTPYFERTSQTRLLASLRSAGELGSAALRLVFFNRSLRSQSLSQLSRSLSLSRERARVRAVATTDVVLPPSH